MNKSREIKISYWGEKTKIRSLVRAASYSKASILKGPDVPYIFENMFSLLIKENVANLMWKYPNSKVLDKFPSGLQTLQCVIGIIHCHVSFFHSELEDDLLGEDLLSGKKVRNTGLPETKW